MSDLPRVSIVPSLVMLKIPIFAVYFAFLANRVCVLVRIFSRFS